MSVFVLNLRNNLMKSNFFSPNMTISCYLDGAFFNIILSTENQTVKGAGKGVIGIQVNIGAYKQLFRGSYQR